MRGIGVTVSIGSLGEAVRPLGGQVPCDCLRSQLPTATRYFFLSFRKGHGPLALKTPIRSLASHQFHPPKTTTAMKLSFIAVSVCVTMHFLFFRFTIICFNSRICCSKLLILSSCCFSNSSCCFKRFV